MFVCLFVVARPALVSCDLILIVVSNLFLCEAPPTRPAALLFVETVFQLISVFFPSGRGGMSQGEGP